MQNILKFIRSEKLFCASK